MTHLTQGSYSASYNWYVWKPLPESVALTKWIMKPGFQCLYDLQITFEMEKETWKDIQHHWHVH